MKSTGTIEDGTGLWHAPNTGATNSSGFTCLAEGSRYGTNGIFHKLGDTGNFWSSKQRDMNLAWYRTLLYSDAWLYRGNTDRRNGLSVRCLKND